MPQWLQSEDALYEDVDDPPTLIHFQPSTAEPVGTGTENPVSPEPDNALGGGSVGVVCCGWRCLLVVLVLVCVSLLAVAAIAASAVALAGVDSGSSEVGNRSSKKYFSSLALYRFIAESEGHMKRQFISKTIPQLI